jgi:hypothetical protein
MNTYRNLVYFVSDEYLQESRMREICTSGSTRGSARRALLRKCRLSLSTLRGVGISPSVVRGGGSLL